jgi:hypothetical protein
VNRTASIDAARAAVREAANKPPLPTWEVRYCVSDENCMWPHEFAARRIPAESIDRLPQIIAARERVNIRQIEVTLAIKEIPS